MSFTMYDVVNANKSKVPRWGNKKEYIVVHYLGAVGDNHNIDSSGRGAHFYIHHNGDQYQAADLDAILWQVGTNGYYTQKHPSAFNSNCIGIEMCCYCDGDKTQAEDPKWYFTTETQESCVELVQYLMKKLDIPADHVIRHYDVVNKTCPAPYVHNNKYKTSWTWDEFMAKVKGKSVAVTTSTAPATSSTATTTTTTTTSGGFDMANLATIKKGSKGSVVKAAQTLLIGYGYSCGSYGADGSFGDATGKAVKQFQTAKGLTVDGIIGPKTWSKLLGVS